MSQEERDCSSIDEAMTDSLISAGEYLIWSIFQRDNFSSIQNLIDNGAPLWYQEDEGGNSALHAAAHVENVELVKYLLEKGAVWNAVDKLQNTAADVALSLNNTECYTFIRDAGIRSELLLNVLSLRNTDHNSNPFALVLKNNEDTALGSTDVFLSSKLHFEVDVNGQEICYVQSDEEEVGVMMGWEREIMRETSMKLCHSHPRLKDGLKILNIGFGLGIIDTFFQELPIKPSHHVIVEAHPDVLTYMKSKGWYDRPGVIIVEGKWQDALSNSDVLCEGFDVVYTDTFSEDYGALQQFFKQLPHLLCNSDARFGFFNGLGATIPSIYDVYTHLAELHLGQVGLDVTWSDVNISLGKDSERWGGTRKYFGRIPCYRLPIANIKK